MSLLFLLLLVVIAAILQVYSVRHCLDGLSYEFKTGKQVVECDEEFDVISTVTNSGRLPVLFLHLSEGIPKELSLKLEGTRATREERNTTYGLTADFVDETMYIMPRQKAKRVIKATLSKRGRYLFNNATMTAGDLLGIKEKSLAFEYSREVVVLPKRLENVSLDPSFGNYLGDISVRRFILSDPILTVGFREYTGREPQRDISWPRTLRDGRIMAKQYDYTAEMTAQVILNIAGGTETEIERCFSAARTVCERLEDQRISYSFITNASTSAAAGVWSYIGDGLGKRHLYSILEGLGRATLNCTFSFEKLMDSAAGSNDKTRGYILITPEVNAESAALVRHLEGATGQKVLVMNMADRETEAEDDSD